jgi:HEAT repeat protein
MRTTLIILLAATLATAEPKPGDEGTAEYKKALELVKQLGSPQFAVREAAAKQLVEMEQSAIPALKEGAKSTDAEVRARCIALIPQAQSTGWKRRAAEYVADTEGKKKHDLPLLTEWEKLIGKPDAGTRKLFAEMISAKGEFLAQVADNRNIAADLFAVRCRVVLKSVETSKGQNKANLGDLAAMLFVDALAKSPIDPRSPAELIDLLKNSTVIETIGAAEAGAAFRRLLVGWVEAQPPNLSTEAYVRFADLVRKKPFSEAVPFLIRLAQSKRRGSLAERLLAIEALGAIGGREAAAGLADLIPNDSLMFAGDMWKEFREGDSALAASLRMHGKKTGDYGLIASEMSLVNVIGSEQFPYSVYGFPNADARARAIKKWQEDVLKPKESKEKK